MEFFKRISINLKWKQLSFCNIMNVFNVIFGQFIASLLNRSIYPTEPNFLIVVYLESQTFLSGQEWKYFS